MHYVEYPSADVSPVLSQVHKRAVGTNGIFRYLRKNKLVFYALLIGVSVVGNALIGTGGKPWALGTALALSAF